jgi:hypothetical protein
MKRSGMLLLLAVLPGAADASQLAIADFAYVDTSGEARDQEAAHRARLTDFMARVREALAGDTDLVKVSAADARAQARAAGADRLLSGGIHKMSSLVQYAEVTLTDTDSGHVLFKRVYSFRGDDEPAWRHAAAFIAAELQGRIGPVRLAVLPFEVDDFGPGAALGVRNPVVRGAADAATRDVRAALAASGRYALVEVRTSGADLRDCDGCEAAIAARAGAGQSLLGVIRPISQTDYAIWMVLRDAHTGAVLRRVQSGLRVGAAYSWGRGARQLVEDQLLASETPR